MVGALHAVHVRPPDAAWFGFIGQINRLPATSSTILNLNLKLIDFMKIVLIFNTPIK
jgi:hypothetical protein